MVDRMRSRRGASSKTIAITLALMIALVVAGVSVYKTFFSGGARPTGVAEVDSLPAGQLAPPETITQDGREAPPQSGGQ